MINNTQNNTSNKDDISISDKRRNEITKILYTNSSDDSECMRIKFEDIEKVIDLLNDLYNQ